MLVAEVTALFLSRCFPLKHLLVRSLGRCRLVSTSGNTSFPFNVINPKHKQTKHTNSLSFENVGQLQAEIRQERKGSKGKEADRGDYCTI